MIRTLQDLRKFAGADWKDVSDEDLVTAYAKKVNIDPAEVGIQLGMYAGDGGKNSKRLSSSIDSYQANLYGLGEAIAEKAGFSGVQEAMGRRRRANEFEAAVQSQRAKEMGAVDRFADVNSASDFGDYAVGLGIQSLPYLGEALGGGMVGRGLMMGTKAALRGAEAAGDVAAANRARTALNRGATAGAVGASYPSAVGDVLSSQRDQADTMDLGSAAALGIPYAALNAFGLEGALARRSGFRSGIEALDNISGIKGGLARMGATGLRTGLTEAVTETAQEGLNQVGRMQVDPNETFFNERSAERFLESAIGGGLLGGIGGAGLGGWRRSKPVDLLGTANPTPPTQEEIAAEQTAAAQAQTAAEITQSPARVSNVFSEQQQRLIDMGVRPTKKAMDLLDEIDASGLAPEQLTGVTTAMAQNKYKRAATLLADAIIEAKKNPQPAAAAPAAPVAPTPAPTDVNQAPQAVQAQEEKPKVRRVTAAEAAAQQAAIQPPAEVLGDPAGAAPEAPVVTTPPAEPVVQRKQKRVVTPAAPAQAFVAEEPAEQTEPVVETPQAAAPLAEQDLADIAEATGQGALAQAQQEEEAGARQDAPDVDPKEAANQIFQVAFQGSANPQRDAEIAQAYVTSMANAPKGSKAKIAEAIGAKYGIGPKMVAKLGNTTNLVAAGEKLGYTPQQVREILGVGNNTKSAPKAELTPEQADRQEAMQDQADRAAKSQALEAAGISSEEGETSGLGGDDKSETWKQGGKGAGDTANAKDEAIANEVQSLLEKQDELRQTAEELRDQGQDQAAEAIEEQINSLEGKVASAMKKYETFLQSKKKKKAKASESATSVERAGEAWDNAIQDIDGAPPWDSLTDAQQQAFADFGESNWKLSDIASFVDRLDRGLAKKGKKVAPKSFKERELAMLRGAELAEQQLRAIGIDRPADFVSEYEFYEDFDPDEVEGEIVPDGQGGYLIRVNLAKVSSAAGTALVMTHEVGHAVDMGLHGGIYSDQPEMGVAIDNKRIIGTGAVSRELLSLYKSNDIFREHFAYPFDTKAYPEFLDQPVLLRIEMFGQLFALYANPKGRALLKQVAPVAYNYMQEVMQHVQSAGPIREKTTEVAEERTRTFQARDTSRRSGAPGARSGNVGQNRLASRQAQTGSQRLGGVPPQFQEPVRNTVERLQDAGRYVLNNFTFTEDLINRAKSLGITAAGQLQTIYRQRASLQGRLERDVERVAQLYNKVPEQERGTGPSSVNKFIYDATREGKWGFEPDWRQKKPPMDAAMQRRFDGLSKESQALVRAVFKHGDDVLAEKKRTVQDAINGEYDQAIKDAQAAGETEKVTKLTNAKNQQVKKFQSLLKLTEFKPYAPMKRFGDYVVIARSAKYMAATPKEKTKLESSPDDYHVNFAESPAAAREMQRELEAQGSFAEVIVREKEKAQGEMYNGTLDAFTKLRAAVESDLANTTDPKQKAAVNRMQGIITELYLSSLAESSARKAEMRRRGVAGELDMLRSFATQGRADAMFLASAKYSDASFKAINEMRKQVKAGGNQLAKSETFNEIMARHFASLKYDYSPFTDRVTRLTSIWFLATSPMYYLQNLTQPFMMSLPFMTKRHSYAASASELIKAYTDLGPMFKNLKLGEQFNFAAAPADVRAAISELVDRGRIDIGINTELGKIQLEEGSALRRGWNKVDRYLSDLSQKMEAVNRLSTAIAAYRMEMKKPGATAASALEYADSVLAQTHGDYTRINAPRAFNTNLGRVMLQFRKFQLIQLTLMAKLIKDLKDPKERAAAGKALAFILGHTAVMAGVVGLPGFATISWLLGKVLGDDDEPFDLEVALREVIGDNDVASLILRGAPTVAGVDLSGKVGMGNLLAILPFNDLDLSARSGVESAMANLLGGPFGGLVIRAADGLGLISKGDYYKGLEQLLPTGISNAMKGYRTATDGVTRRNGDVLVSAEEVGALSGFAQALGIPLSSTTERTLLSKYKLDTEEGLRNAATRIKNDFLKARKEGDGEAMGEAREAWMQLQDRRMELGFSRQPMSGLLNASKEQSGRERNTIGGIQFDKNSRRFVENLVEDDDED